MNKKIAKYAAAVALSTYIVSTGSAFAAEVKVQPGTTLYSIASKYHISVDELKRINDLKTNNIYVGQVLKLSETVQVSSTSVSSPATTYTVKAGDTLTKIANTYKISVSTLKSLNNLKTDVIRVGQVLKVSNATIAPTTTTTVTTNPVVNNTTYTVKSGDTLSKISTTTKVSIADIKLFNNLSSNTIYVGQILKLTQNPLNVDKLISDSKQLIGIPYLWGGTTKIGFDCSGFTQYVFGLQGIKIPRTSQEQWSFGKSVTVPSPGDLVFYTTYAPGPTHVGIYIGDNKMFESGSSTGITIADMNSSYWKPRFLGYKRVY